MWPQGDGDHSVARVPPRLRLIMSWVASGSRPQGDGNYNVVKTQRGSSTTGDQVVVWRLDHGDKAMGDQVVAWRLDSGHKATATQRGEGVGAGAAPRKWVIRLWCGDEDAATRRRRPQRCKDADAAKRRRRLQQTTDETMTIRRGNGRIASPMSPPCDITED